MSKRWAQVGERGVLLVTAELIGRGFIPYRPVVDDHGVDLMLKDGTRLQVKSANLSTLWDRKGPCEKRAYQFSLQKKNSQTDMREGGTCYTYRDVSADADYLILVGLDEYRFWIMPTRSIATCKHIAISQDPSYFKVGPSFRFNKAVRDGENRWDLLSPTTSIPEVDISALNEPCDDEIASLAGWTN